MAIVVMVSLVINTRLYKSLPLLDYVVDLGVTIDSKLKCSVHINQLVATAIKHILGYYFRVFRH